MHQSFRRNNRPSWAVLAAVAAVAVMALLPVTGCVKHVQQPFGPDRLIPPDQSRTTFMEEVPAEERERLMEAARALRCTHPLGCTCFLDDIRTSCAFAFSLIDAGLARCVGGCHNIGRF